LFYPLFSAFAFKNHFVGYVSILHFIRPSKLQILAVVSSLTPRLYFLALLYTGKCIRYDGDREAVLPLAQTL